MKLPGGADRETTIQDVEGARLAWSSRLSARCNWKAASSGACLARVAIERRAALGPVSEAQNEARTELSALESVPTARATARAARMPSALCATLELPSAAMTVSLPRSGPPEARAFSDFCNTCSAELCVNALLQVCQRFLQCNIALMVLCGRVLSICYLTWTRERRCACSRAPFSPRPCSNCFCASAGKASAEEHQAPTHCAISSFTGSFPSSLHAHGWLKSPVLWTLCFLNRVCNKAAMV